MQPAGTACLKRLVLACALFGVLMTAPRSLAVLEGQAPPADLQSVFNAGGMLQDRNGDGVVDFVSARLALGAKASAAEIAAASDVAARLGFDTSAMDLPLTAAPRDVAGIVAIGAEGARRAGVQDMSGSLADLAPGQGLIALSAGGGVPVVVVAGKDDQGTRAAAALLAGRLPAFGDLKGPSLTTIVDDVKTLLKTQPLVVRDVRVPSVRAAADGSLAAVNVDLSVGSAGDIATVRRVLNELRTKPSAAVPQTPPATAGERPASSPQLSYDAVPSIVFRIAAPSTRSVDVQLARSASPPAAASGRRPGAGAKENLDLSNIYTPDCLLGDGDTNLIPDRLDTLLVPAGEGVERTLDVAARLGLESAGIVVPIAMPADAVTKPDAEPTMVLIGTTHPIVERLIKDGKLQQPSLQPGEGLIQVVRKAFGEKGAVIITGGDAAGLARALEQLAERFPHIWARGKDRTTIDDVEEQIRRFVSNRSPEGQAAAALYAIDRIGSELEGKQLEQATVSVHVDKADPGLRDFVRQTAANRLKAGQIEVVVDNRDVQKAGAIFEDDFTVASEVKQFWDVFEARVLPAVRDLLPEGLRDARGAGFLDYDWAVNGG